jgi:hypothetical protein
MGLRGGLRIGIPPGGGAAPVAPLDPDAAFGANLVAWWRSDLGCTVSQWDDQSGNAFHLTQATATNQPTIQAGVFNGHDGVRFDGADNFMSNATLDIAAPGTGATTFWAVVRGLTYTTNDEYWSGGTAGRVCVRQSGTEPALVMAATTVVNSNNAAAMGVAARILAKFNGSTADYLKVLGTVVTGASAGTTNPAAGFFLGSRPGPTNFGNFEIAELAIINLDVAHNDARILATDAYGVARYGAVAG